MALLGRRNLTVCKVPLYVTYVCSKCGSQVVTEHVINETGYSSGAAWNLDDIREKAYHDAAGRMTGKLLDILEERKDGQYRTAKFKCKCGKCGNREPWARLCFDGFSSITALVILIGIIAAIYCFAVNNYAATWTAIGIMAALLLTYITYRICHTRKMEKLTAALSVKSLPSFSQELDEVLAKALSDSESEHRELYIDKKLRNVMKGRLNQ